MERRILRNFEDVATYLDEKMDYIPLNFMLGFFVSEVVRRWGILFNNIGLLDKYYSLSFTFQISFGSKSLCVCVSTFRFRLSTETNSRNELIY